MVVHVPVPRGAVGAVTGFCLIQIGNPSTCHFEPKQVGREIKLAVVIL